LIQFPRGGGFGECLWSRAGDCKRGVIRRDERRIDRQGVKQRGVVGYGKVNDRVSGASGGVRTMNGIENGITRGQAPITDKRPSSVG
jgi:hypothetical protein